MVYVQSLLQTFSLHNVDNNDGSSSGVIQPCRTIIFTDPLAEMKWYVLLLQEEDRE